MHFFIVLLTGIIIALIVTYSLFVRVIKMQTIRKVNKAGSRATSKNDSHILRDKKIVSRLLKLSLLTLILIILAIVSVSDGNLP